MYIQWYYNWFKHSILVSLSNWLNMLIFSFLAILDFISHVPRGKELNGSHPFEKTFRWEHSFQIWTENHNIYFMIYILEKCRILVTYLQRRTYNTHTHTWIYKVVIKSGKLNHLDKLSELSLIINRDITGLTRHQLAPVRWFNCSYRTWIWSWLCHWRIYAALRGDESVAEARLRRIHTHFLRPCVTVFDPLFFPLYTFLYCWIQ